MDNSDVQLLASQSKKQNLQSQDLGATIQHRVFVEFDEKSRLPTALLSLGNLCSAVKDNLGANLADQCKRVIIQNQVNLDEITVNEFDSQIPFQIEFKDGTYRSSTKQNPISVTSFVVRQNSISVIVRGDSADAQEVISGIYNSVMEKAGYTKKFSEECVHARAHTCYTVARLNFGIGSVFSEAVRNVIESTLRSESHKFKNVGSMRVGISEAELKKHMIVPKIDAVEFEITRFDTASGKSEECKIRISPRTTSDVDVGDYVFVSEYPEDIHNELVSAFTNALAE